MLLCYDWKSCHRATLVLKSAQNALEGKPKITLSNKEKMYIIVRHIEKKSSLMV